MRIDFGYGHYDGGVDSNQYPHGKGTIYYYKPDTKIIDGSVEATWVNGVMQGDATVRYGEHGEYGIYVGQYDKSEGHRIGYGVMTYADGHKYEGEWKDNLRHGKGTLSYPDNAKYIGSFDNDKMHGYGEYHFANGNVYKGEFEDDYFSGKGTFYYKTGGWYEGEFKDDKFHGKGTLYYSDGTIYQQGTWENDNFVG